MKYLVAGLGNIGQDYVHTRHNVGFDVADAFAKMQGVTFSNDKKAWIAETKFKGRSIFLLKPTTFMNLSGEAVRYWMNSLKISRENLLIVSDDLALPFGSLRLRPSGGAAGHNGLTSIIECIQTEQFARLRFGIGSDFPKGRQSDFVLGNWSSSESLDLPEKINLACEIIKGFTTVGIQSTMNAYNNK